MWASLAHRNRPSGTGMASIIFVFHVYVCIVLPCLRLVRCRIKWIHLAHLSSAHWGGGPYNIAVMTHDDVT